MIKDKLIKWKLINDSIEDNLKNGYIGSEGDNNNIDSTSRLGNEDK
ncbi:hypothetical protein ACSXEL_00055 [Clostridium perfringens]